MSLVRRPWIGAGVAGAQNPRTNSCTGAKPRTGAPVISAVPEPQRDAFRSMAVVDTRHARVLGSEVPSRAVPGPCVGEYVVAIVTTVQHDPSAISVVRPSAVIATSRSSITQECPDIAAQLPVVGGRRCSSSNFRNVATKAEGGRCA